MTAWYSRAWQSDEGLPNNTVHALVQTPDGYLWLGTPSGLVRFDGIEFEEFAPTTFIAPPNRGVVTMLRGRQGSLWLGMDRGAVVHLQGASSQAYAEALPNNIPNGLAEGADGSVWVAYRGGAVYRITREGKIDPVGTADGLPEGADICALTTDGQKRVWFAKAGQFGMISNGAFQTLHRFEVGSTRITASRHGGVWLCQPSRLLKHETTGELRDLGAFSPGREDTVITDLLEDREGALWISTSFSGLFRFDGSGFEPIETTHQEILSLLEDKEGNVWAGTQGGGLNRVRRRAITLEGVESGLPFAAVQSICQDTAGTIWAAAQNGSVVKRVAGKWQRMPRAESWPRDVNCVTADPAGGLWLGTRSHGLFRWRDGEFVSWGDPAQVRGQTAHTLLVSRAGDLWIGEESPPCLQRLRGGQLTTFEAPIDSRVIRAMAEDAAGNIWAGTSKGVLLRVSGERIEEVAPRPFGELASIRCLHSTPDGALWIGYAGWGLGRILNGRYAEIRTEHGLYDDYLSHILSDKNGWLWFGANRGIFKVRERDLEEVAEGRGARVRSIYYGRGEGLPSLQATFGDSPDVLRSHDGHLWIPMRTALAVVDPEKLREEFGPPPALVRRVVVDEHLAAGYSGVLPPAKEPVLELVADSEKLRLPPRHRRIEFHFSALNFSAPENIQFRYRLEGFDEDWVEAGTHRVASYSRLPAGSYRFRVVACNTEGLWSSAGAVLPLVVSPFFYQTWWFRTIGVAVFTLCVVAVVRYVSFRRLHRHLRQLEGQAALHQERVRIAKDIHDDVGANLTQIALLGELARQDHNGADKAGERLEKISGAAREAIKSLDEIVWAVNPRNDTLAHLIDYTGQYALDYLRLAGVRCRVDFPELTPYHEVSTDVRHNLFLIVKEALNNVIKYAQAGTVWLRAVVTDEGLRLELEDDGCGFEEQAAAEGADGLRNMRQRAEEIGGRCEIHSRPGTGTKVVVEVPWADRARAMAAPATSRLPDLHKDRRS